MDDKTMLERSAFEQWAKGMDFPIARDRVYGSFGGAYKHGATQGMWLSWQARARMMSDGSNCAYEILARLAYAMFEAGFTTGEREKWVENFRAIASAAEIGKGMGVGE